VTSIGDLLAGARRTLLADANFAALIGVDVGADPAGQPWADGWVFRGQTANNDPTRNPAGSGKASVTMQMRDPWGSPDSYHSQQFRLLRFSIWADCTRAALDPTLIVTRDAELRADRIATAIRAVFHNPANALHTWSGVPIISSVEYGQLHISDVPSQDGLVEGALSFAVVAF
jgi:hypothetical protein